MTNNDVEMIVQGNEKYIQINDIGLKDIERVWKHLSTRFPGFLVDFCFTNSLAPEKFLLSIGAEVLENSLIMRLSEKDFINLPTESKVMPVTMENFTAFADCHDRANPEMYWNSQRLLADFESWDIFAISSGAKITDYALLRDNWELYCVNASSMDGKIALASAAAKKNFAAGAEDMIFWAERNNFTELGAALHLGFRREGYYIAYRVKA
jgi:hypothetical protein